MSSWPADLPALTRRDFAAATLLPGAVPWARAQATGARHALLVGVSEYPVSAGSRQPFHLSGPANDVQLIRSLLLQRGFAPAAVQVLADGVPGAGLPTRAAILGALDALAAQVKAGDFVFLHFAGHGSQMPANPNTPEGRAESDGLHEIFLPRDIGHWNGGTGVVERAIVDFELNRRLDAFLAREAFVWAIFDACHSATLMRGVDADVRYRHVDPRWLGVPEARLGAPAGRTRGPEAGQRIGRVELPKTRGGGEGRGGFVAFYAAQTTQTTPEMRLPADHPQRKPYGLFGFSLAEAMAALDGITYRQLSQFVLQRYQAQNHFTPTPLFTGTHLDSPVFGTRTGTGVRQWPVQVEKGEIRLRAGLLAQLEVGTLLAVMPHAAAAPQQALGPMRVQRADVMTATLVPVSEPGKAGVDIATLPPTAVARLVQPATPSFRLRVLVAVDPGPTDVDAKEVARAVEALKASRAGGIPIDWVKPGAAHDLRLHLEAQMLWLVPPSAQLFRDGPHKTHSIRVRQPEFERKLADSLQHVGRAQNLLRIASATNEVPGQRALQVEATVQTARTGATRRLDPLTVPPLGEGDRVTLSLRNPGRTAIDLTVLYLDASYGINALFPLHGASNRIEAGGAETLPIEINVQTVGIERMLLIAVEARTASERHDFSFLQQPRLPATRSVINDMQALFEQAGFGPPPGATTRGAQLVPAPERIDMRVIAFRVG